MHAHAHSYGPSSYGPLPLRTALAILWTLSLCTVAYYLWRISYVAHLSCNPLDFGSYYYTVMARFRCARLLQSSGLGVCVQCKPAHTVMALCNLAYTGMALCNLAHTVMALCNLANTGMALCNLANTVMALCNLQDRPDAVIVVWAACNSGVGCL